MAVMWAYILDDEVVAKATALFVGLRSQFVTSKEKIVQREKLVYE